MLWPINATTTNLELSVSAQQRTGASHRSARFACAARQHRYPMQGQKENHAVGGRCPGRAGKRPRFGRAMAIGNAGLTDGWSHRHGHAMAWTATASASLPLPPTSTSNNTVPPLFHVVGQVVLELGVVSAAQKVNGNCCLSPSGHSRDMHGSELGDWIPSRFWYSTALCRYRPQISFLLVDEPRAYRPTHSLLV